ncbi:hypothetical protein BRN38_06900 [Xanthomonas oryzae pv. oryzae]|nr:hypothetical protein BRN38_06900 [Xanthomonas oryzae pv. oryzae]
MGHDRFFGRCNAPRPIIAAVPMVRCESGVAVGDRCAVQGLSLHGHRCVAASLSLWEGARRQR